MLISTHIRLLLLFRCARLHFRGILPFSRIAKTVSTTAKRPTFVFYCGLISYYQSLPRTAELRLLYRLRTTNKLTSSTTNALLTSLSTREARSDALYRPKLQSAQILFFTPITPPILEHFIDHGSQQFHGLAPPQSRAVPTRATIHAPREANHIHLHRTIRRRRIRLRRLADELEVVQQQLQQCVVQCEAHAKHECQGGLE